MPAPEHVQGGSAGRRSQVDRREYKLSLLPPIAHPHTHIHTHTVQAVEGVAEIRVRSSPNTGAGYARLVVLVVIVVVVVAVVVAAAATVVVIIVVVV